LSFFFFTYYYLPLTIHLIPKKNLILHIIHITSSTFTRGNEARSQNDILTTPTLTLVLLFLPTIIISQTILIHSISIIYSLKKSIVNHFPSYSVLNPLTNSLSLSTRSNGVRPSSHSITMNILILIISTLSLHVLLGVSFSPFHSLPHSLSVSPLLLHLLLTLSNISNITTS